MLPALTLLFVYTVLGYPGRGHWYPMDARFRRHQHGLPMGNVDPARRVCVRPGSASRPCGGCHSIRRSITSFSPTTSRTWTLRSFCRSCRGRTSVFVKRSLMKIPVIGYAMRLGDFIPVDRDGRVESAKDSVTSAARVLSSGLNITSFVEGTRSRDGRLLPFKKGPFYLATETGAPVVPVSIWGTESMMKKGSLRIYPGTAHVTFHAPLDPKDFATREDLMAAVRSAVESGLPEWMWARSTT